jgi:rhodanese-related sulfurtransferase
VLRNCLALLLAAAAATPLAAAQPVQPANPQIDYPGYRRLAAEVQPYRDSRLIAWAEFDRLRARPGVLILDARSESAFRAGHIEGAVNLPLPDFTAESLARIVGRNRDRPILIYCNNNFRNDRAPVVVKLRPLALNIQTFINLVGYGYRNVRELNAVIDFNDPQVRWVRG